MFENTYVSFKKKQFLKSNGKLYFIKKLQVCDYVQLLKRSRSSLLPECCHPPF